MTPAEAAGLAGAMGFLANRPPQALSGGQLNHVFRVVTARGPVVLKHAPPHVAALPEVPLDPVRIRHERLGLAWAATVVGRERIPRVLAYAAARHALVMEDLGPLPHLGTWLASSPDDALAALEDLGRLVGQLHAAPALPGFANPSVQATRHAVQYAQVPSMLASLGLEPARGAAAVRLGEVLQRPGRVPIMGDLWPPSVLRRDGVWVLIDWELSHVGRACQDVAHLEAHLLLLDPRAAPSRIAAFRRGYQAAAPPWDAEEHAMAAVHRASELLARTVGAFPLMDERDPRWQDILDAALDALEEGS